MVVGLFDYGPSARSVSSLEGKDSVKNEPESISHLRPITNYLHVQYNLKHNTHDCIYHNNNNMQPEILAGNKFGSWAPKLPLQKLLNLGFD